MKNLTSLTSQISEPELTSEKYLHAISLCCTTVIELNLRTNQYIKHLFLNTEHNISKGAYTKDFVCALCENFAFEFIQCSIDKLNIDKINESFEADEPYCFPYYLANNDACAPCWYECSVGFFKQDNTPFALITIKAINLADINAEQLLQNTSLRQQQISDERYKIVVEQTGTIVFEYIADGNYRYVSPLMEKMFKGTYGEGDVISQWRKSKVIHPDDDKLLSQSIGKGIYPTTNKPLHIRLLDKRDHYVWCKLRFVYTHAADGRLERILGMLNNEDEAVSSRMLLEYRAQYDALTGVYNAQTFYQLSHNILREHPQHSYAIMRMDISRFKAINELYGIEDGDRVLCRIAACVETEVLGKGICGRLHSDIFAICVPATTQNDAICIMSRIASSVEAIIPGSGIHPYFGIYMITERTTPVNILCDRAGLALAQIKGNLLQNYSFYDEVLHQKEIAERNIESKMELALQNGEFIVYLQPKHSLVNSRAIGAEALVRWQHPKEGLLSPASFLPLFERNGFIVKLDEYVWEEVFKLLRKWLNKGLCPVSVSLNVSRVHIYNPNFVQTILGLLQKYNVPGYLIELELTESAFVDNQDELYKTLLELQKEGLNFSIDDFGSGYSSLNMLKSSPAGILKLDREFLCAADGDKKAQTVVKHTISMAHQLDMQVVAEGVENVAQAKFLIDAGCLAAQGFLYSHPMPIVDFEKIMIYN